MKITIMDTTLRDGEQTSGVSFTDEEKLSMAKLLLDDLKVDRIEVASARVSEGEYEAVKKISAWAEKHNHLDKIEVLGFVDGDVSINWIREAGCQGDEPPHQGITEARYRTVEKKSRAACRRYPASGYPCPYSGTSGQYLSRRLVEWHASLPGLCVLHD